MSEHEHDGGSPMSMETPPAATPVPAPKASAGRIIVVGIVITALATLGGIFAFRSSGGSDPVAGRVSASSDVFVQITLEPSIEQQRAVRDFADRFPGGRDAATVLVDRAVDQILRDAGGPSFEDVDAWLGSQVAIVVPSLEAGGDNAVLIAETTDADAATATLRDITGGDVASRVVGPWVYLAPTEAAIDDVISAASADPLTRDRLFLNQREKVGGDGVLLARIDSAGLLESAPQGLLSGLPTGSAAGPGVFGVRLTDEGIVATAISPVTEETGSGIPAIMDGLPSGLTGAVSLFDVASMIRNALPAAEGFLDEDPATLLDQLGFDLERDLLSWLGGETTFAVGDPMTGEFGLLIEATDPEAMASTVGRLRGFADLAGGDGSIVIEGSETDFTVSFEGGRAARVVVDGARLVAAISPDLVDRLIADDGKTLAEDVVYRRLLPESSDVAMQGFVSFRTLRTLMPPPVDAYLNLFEGLAFRSRFESGDAIFTMTLAYSE